MAWQLSIECMEQIKNVLIGWQKFRPPRSLLSATDGQTNATLRVFMFARTVFAMPNNVIKCGLHQRENQNDWRISFCHSNRFVPT